METNAVKKQDRDVLFKFRIKNAELRIKGGAQVNIYFLPKMGLTCASGFKAMNQFCECKTGSAR
jgi:hypothetical protein